MTVDELLNKLNRMVQRSTVNVRPFTEEEASCVSIQVLQPLTRLLSHPGPYPDTAGLNTLDYVEALNQAGVRCESLLLVPARMPADMPWIVSHEDYVELMWRRVVSRHRKERLVVAKLTDRMRDVLRITDAKDLQDVWQELSARMSGQPFTYMNGLANDPPYPGWLLERLIEYALCMALFEKSRHLEERLCRFERLWPFLLQAPLLGYRRGSQWQVLALC